MKRITVIAAAALALWTAAGVQARPLDAIQKDGTLRLATEGYYAPFAYFDGKQLTGFEVELAQMLAGKIGVKYEWKTISFDALLTGLQQDRWDLVISSHGITPEREKAVTFGQPHYCSGAIIMALDPTIRSTKDLAGRTVSVQTGSTYMQYLEKNVTGIKRLVNFPTNEAARNALLSKRADAWVTERFIAKEMQQKNPNAQLQQGEMVLLERIAAAVAKDNKSLADAWNKALRQAMADGSYAKLSQKYFHEDIRCPE
ncbi:transporter substrate-binding domain-containing protein [Delftia sp. PS-11]|uniref:ABC transporter substrate-binding protein n=1 Tax=Delftia sp. PS-11 TaxID=2767222 RepID=UPI00245573CB|nr:transporter substrate-binding domain-containing protein [Delftia sp. PS-11]KAJ8746071.1 amino acid ABC transporter substrate-binding protein [Delftia sp. PS-11]